MKTPLLRSKVLEKHIEKYLVNRVKGCGGEAYKFTSPNRVNVPDRLVLKKDTNQGGRAVFVEVKAPGEEATSGQLREHDKLVKMGFSVYVVDTEEAVNDFIKAEFGR